MTTSGKTVVVKLERVQEGHLGMWRSCIDEKWVKPSLSCRKNGHGMWQSTAATVPTFHVQIFPVIPRHVDALTLAVCLVEQDGLVAEWNKFQPTCAIEPGNGNVRRETTVVSKIALRLHRSCSKNFL